MIIILGGLGVLALVAGLHTDGRRRVILLLIAGMALGGTRGFNETQRRTEIGTMLASSAPVALRVNMTILEGWSTSRWGLTTKVRVEAATHGPVAIDLPRRCRFEVRTTAGDANLPRAGTEIQALVAVKGTPDRPLLVASSPFLLDIVQAPRGAPAVRDFLATSLINAAGTDSGRIRSAEMAAALALGRRDLVPTHRRQGWRNSGLGHALAVSGLHVGIVSGTLWLIAVMIGLQPKTIRWILLVTIPGYTILAGAAPSAVRACLMVCLYLIARLMGRAALPLGTVLTAASIMLLVSPGLIVQPGFQLTVAVTAALIRWAPQLAERLRGPRWFKGAVAIPVVAQLAAAPIVAAHFKTAIPLATFVNLAIPLLLTPAIPASVAAVLLAPIWQSAAGWVLELIGLLTQTLWIVGSLGRHWTVIVPSLPATILILLVVLASTAIRYDRVARVAGAIWLTLILISPAIWLLSPTGDRDRVEMLPVGDGLAATVTVGRKTHLFDGGRYRTEAAELLADTRLRHLGAVIVSHGDEDHAGGIRSVLKSIETEQLIIPSWLIAEPQVVPLLRAARHAGVSVTPVARGSLIRSGSLRLDVLWPPAGHQRLTNNDRSLVIRAQMPTGSIVLTGDIGSSIERILVDSSFLDADLLLVPHHGSASSTSDRFLQSVSPSLALIPAGPENRHHHPHPTVLNRLSAQNIPFLFPARDGRCGAVFTDHQRWQAYTMPQ